MKKSKRKVVVLSLMLVLALTVGGILAYFTAGDTKTNEFTVGTVSLDLIEPNWNPANATALSANQQVTKDPQIKNDGTNSEFVFMEVIVPYVNAATANPDGTTNAAADVELFTYAPASTWTEIGTGTKDAVAGTVSHIYAYGTSTECTALAAGVTTPALFNSVTFANLLESSAVAGVDADIVINAYGIQTDNINGGTVVPADVWTVVKNQSPSTDVGASEDPNTDQKN